MFASTVTRIALCGAILATSLAGGAVAGPVADKATEIETLMAAGDTPGALEAADSLMATVWDSGADIGIREALLVAEPAAGVGIYNPRPNETYKIGEPILIYAEPYGYGFGSGGDGLYTIGFIVDLKVMTEAGEVLGEIPSVTNLDLTSRRKMHEFNANLTYTLDGITPGRYILETTLRDKNSEKLGKFENTVEIIE
ncbi:MAG: hypothetical protein CFE33_16970 [Pseudorhodobacter sp. PARRP1]|nr:MAG: hypothetical protein CFE33_16970 [Pseudorhodobacter sp. PARRP1]